MARDAAKAWLYGKFLVALLVEKLIRHASAISPWGIPFGSGWRDFQFMLQGHQKSSIRLGDERPSFSVKSKRGL